VGACGYSFDNFYTVGKIRVMLLLETGKGETFEICV
jgi:hypothetical protein